MAETVLVTGGTGFIAGWCMVELLKRGYVVRTTVRSLSKEAIVRAAVACDGPPVDLWFFAADLSNDEGWDAAAAGCDYARSADHRGGVEDSGTGSYLLNCCRGVAWIIPQVLHPVPVGIVPCRHRLADARRAVAEADVAIALARIAEFRESTVFEGFDYRVAGRGATRSYIA